MCGIVGISGIPDAARLAYLGLYSLQHRGQESSGIVAIDAAGVPRLHKGMGLVGDVLNDSVLAELPGDVAVGHTRYATMGSTVLENAQPLLAKYRGGPFAIAHNGNLTNADGLRRELVASGSIFNSSSDTEAIVHLVARSQKHGCRSRSSATPSRSRRCLQPGGDGRSHDVRRRRSARVPAPRHRTAGRRHRRRVRDLRPRHAWGHPGPRARARRHRADFGRRGGAPGAAPARSDASLRVRAGVFRAPRFSKVFGGSVDRARRALGRQLAREHPAHNGRARVQRPRLARTPRRSASPRSRASGSSTG